VPALIVAGVALGVQQLDNDLLAPLIYGRALKLHPLVVLFSIVAGGALLGFAGTVLAVPVTAVIINMLAEARSAGGSEPLDSGGDGRRHEALREG
jgi:predicted PurR-regulated permease PerM